MLPNCKQCGGEVCSNGSGYKCRSCGATFDSLEELKPTAGRMSSASHAASRGSVYVPQSVSMPLTANVSQSAGVPYTVAPTVISEMEPEDIYAKTNSGVVEIITEFGRASGLLISKKGLVLTNAHAVINANSTPCTDIFVKHGEERVPARLIAIGDTDNHNPHNVDLALLATEHPLENAAALTLGDSSKVKIGQRVYYIGNSKGEGLCMTAGIVSDNHRKLVERYFIMTDAATNPGNSGGPLFNHVGEVIGVHVSAHSEADGMKYAIPVNTVRLFLNMVEDQLKMPHGKLADDLLPLSKESMESVSAGVILTLVLSGISLIVKNIEFIKEIFDTVG